METINLPQDRPAGKYANRKLARTVAFQLFYQEDLNPGSRKQFAESFLKQELPDYEPLMRFAETLVNGTAEKKEKIDAILAGIAQHWSLSRMSVIDRNILRIAVYELLFMDTPKEVVINEAVELAKKFGTEHSAAFVNGILNNINHETI
ncbi:MAG: transcription antitermination factor NusB [Planctomycetaceae bacterium]|jgi:N utilization substance protein B|nr:transcription antitermination factor NusB [Planctomycetaceae bacterium]